MPLDQLASIARDLIVTIAAAVGAVVAVCGLNTWNRQLKGGSEYELARRVLKRTYLLRDAFMRVRSPFMFATEMPKPPTVGDRVPTREEERYYGVSEAYQARWNRVIEARTELQSELLEAEVLWGKEAIKDFEPLFKLQGELLLAIQHLVFMLDPALSYEFKQARDKVQSKRRDIVYENLGDDDDKFNNDVAASLSKIEARFKPHLRK